MPQPEEIRNRFNEIIGEPPRWIIRGGLAAVLIVWFMVIAFSMNLPVPDGVNSPVKIVPDVHPGFIINHVDSAVMTAARVSNHTPVHKAQELFIMNGRGKQVITSPKTGYISFEQYNSPGHVFRKGDTIATVIDPQPTFYGYTQLSTDQGKTVRKGDEVNISLLGYPEAEYGYLTGTVNEVLDKENGEKCYIQIKIPGKLTTTFNKKIPVNAVIIGRSHFVFKGKSIFHHLNI
jgi:hypothetical protein